nr:MAK10-like protein [Tanacetum cinerariifolium]
MSCRRKVLTDFRIENRNTLTRIGKIPKVKTIILRWRYDVSEFIGELLMSKVTPIGRRKVIKDRKRNIRISSGPHATREVLHLSLYDNESRNDPRDLSKPVKAISLPQDVLSTSDRCLIELENQVQRLMEAHLALTQPTKVNKITTLCEICSCPYDTQYYMEDPEQVFVEYASSRTDEARVLSARSYPIIDPQCSSHPSTSINAIKADSTEANISQTSLLRPGMEIETQEPEPILKDEFHDLHLNLAVLKVLAHASIYNAILDKYVESLELGKNRSAFVQGEIPAKMEDPGLFTILCRLGDSEPFDTLADLGSCVNVIPLYLFKKLNIELLEETDHIFGLADGTKSYPDPDTPLLVGIGFLATTNAVIDCRMAKIAVGEGITRDAKLNPFTDTLVFRRMVEFLGAIPINPKSNMWESKDLIKNPINKDKRPKEKDGAWHAKIRLIDLDGEEFTKTHSQSPPLESSLKEKV